MNVLVDECVGVFLPGMNINLIEFVILIRIKMGQSDRLLDVLMNAEGCDIHFYGDWKIKIGFSMFEYVYY